MLLFYIIKTIKQFNTNFNFFMNECIFFTVVTRNVKALGFKSLKQDYEL